MLEMLYNVSLNFAWCIIIVNGVFLLINSIRNKTVPYTHHLYMFLLATSYILANRS